MFVGWQKVVKRKGLPVFSFLLTWGFSLITVHFHCLSPFFGLVSKSFGLGEKQTDRENLTYWTSFCHQISSLIKSKPFRGIMIYGLTWWNEMSLLTEVNVITPFHILNWLKIIGRRWIHQSITPQQKVKESSILRKIYTFFQWESPTG